MKMLRGSEHYTDTSDHHASINSEMHDTNDSRASKDLYLVETRDLGVRVNRSVVIIMRGQIASVSLLKDVVD